MFQGLAFFEYVLSELLPGSALGSVVLRAFFVRTLTLAWPLLLRDPSTVHLRHGLTKVWGALCLGGWDCCFSLRAIHCFQSWAERLRYAIVMFPMPMQNVCVLYCVCIFVVPHAAWL